MFVLKNWRKIIKSNEAFSESATCTCRTKQFPRLVCLFAVQGHYCPLKPKTPNSTFTKVVSLRFWAVFVLQTRKNTFWKHHLINLTSVSLNRFIYCLFYLLWVVLSTNGVITDSWGKNTNWYSTVSANCSCSGCFSLSCPEGQQWSRTG